MQLVRLFHVPIFNRQRLTIQNEEKHGQQEDQLVEQGDINERDPDKSSPFPKDRLFPQIKKLRLEKWRLLESDLLGILTREPGC
jgi:hypothetical protein